MTQYSKVRFIKAYKHHEVGERQEVSDIIPDRPGIHCHTISHVVLRTGLSVPRDHVEWDNSI